MSEILGQFSTYGSYTWYADWPPTNTPMTFVNDYDGVCSFLSDIRNAPPRRRKPDGWLYPTSYERSITRKRIAPYARVKAFKRLSDGSTQTHLYEGNLGMLVTQGPSLPALSVNIQNRAVTEALLKLKDQRINFGVAFAEAQQTADFLGDIAGTLARAAVLARRKKWKRAFKTLTVNWRDFPRTWLGYQYAARPLLSDVYGALDELSRKPTRDWITTVKGNWEERETKSGSMGLQPSYTRYTDKTRNGAFVRLDYHPGDEFQSRVSSLGVTNPLEVIWEKVPFSFVVDWMVAGGDYLSTLDAARGWDFLSGSITTRREAIRVYTGGVYPDPRPEWHWGKSTLRGSYRHFHVKRTPYGSSPLPSAPVVKNPLSLGHMANGLSLLAAAFSGGVPRNVKT